MRFRVEWSRVAERQLARHYTHVVEEATRNPLLASEVEAVRRAADVVDFELEIRRGLVGTRHHRRANTWIYTRMPLTVAFERHRDHVLVLAVAYHARRN